MQALRQHFPCMLRVVRCAGSRSLAKFIAFAVRPHGFFCHEEFGRLFDDIPGCAACSWTWTPSLGVVPEWCSGLGLHITSASLQCCYNAQDSLCSC